MGAILNLPGFLTNSLAANDDGSTPFVSFGFDNPINFYGNTYTGCWCNNNGNITFASALRTYTPFGLAGDVPQPIIAPLFTDIDTRAPGSQLMTYGNDIVDGRPAFGVNWVNVGYYNERSDKMNSLQLIIVDRSDIARGDFDFWFNIDRVRFETGQASGGVNGLGGVSAAAGFSNGSGDAGTFYEFPGSRIPGSFLDGNAITGLIHNSFNSDVPGRYVFQVRSGAAPVTPPAPPLNPPTPPSPGAPTIPTGDLKGTVSPYSGEGIPVALYYVGAKATPDYEIDRIPIGLYSVFYGICGLIPQMLLTTIHPNAATVQDVTLSAVPGGFANGWLYGWVIDMVQGTPIADATVVLTDAQGFETTAQVDAAGGWLASVPAGSYTASYSAPGYAPMAQAAQATVEAGCSAGTGPVGLPPNGGGNLMGYIEDAGTQAPLAGASVSLVEAPLYATASGVDGLYGLFMAPPATYTVAVQATGYRPRHGSATLTDGDTTRADFGLVALADPVGSVQGFVKDAGAVPIPGALVRVPGVSQTYTNAMGYYLLADLPTGNVPVQVIADQYIPQQATAAVTSGGMTEQDFTLSQYDGLECSFYGEVRDAATGAGIVGAAIEADALSGTSGPRGAYLLSPVPVPPRTHDVSAENDGYYKLEMAGVLANAGQSLELNLGLVPMSTPVGRLHGIVCDARHSELRLAGALVSCGPYLEAIATTPYGEYLIPYVPSDVSYSATGAMSGYEPLTYEGVEVPQGGTLELDFPLTDSGDLASIHSLTVLVLRAGDNTPLSGMTVDTGITGIPAALTNSLGIVVFPFVPDGSYTISAVGAGFRVGSAPVVVQGQDATVQVLLRGFPDNYTGGQIFGHVTALLIPPGQGVPNCLVTAKTDTLEAAVQGDANGFYVIDNAPTTDGAASVSFDQPDYVPLTMSGVVVVNKQAVEVDATLAPWDGRLPDGWRTEYGVAIALSRPPAAVVATLEATEAVIEERRLDTLCFCATADAIALGRFRRIRYGNLAPTLDSNPLLKIALSIAPGVSVKSMPGAMAIAVPPPKASKS